MTKILTVEKGGSAFEGVIECDTHGGTKPHGDTISPTLEEHTTTDI